MLQRIDAIESQRVIQIGFADVQMGGHRRQLDIGHHAAVLRTIAAGAVELLNRELQRTHVRNGPDAEQRLAQIE